MSTQKIDDVELLEALNLEKRSPIISTKEARKILGKKYESKSDEEIEKLIKEMLFLSKLLIEEELLFRLDEN